MTQPQVLRLLRMYFWSWTKNFESPIAALLSIPAYPFWSLAIFAIDIIIIHQVARYGGAERDDAPRRERVPAA